MSGESPAKAPSAEGPVLSPRSKSACRPPAARPPAHEWPPLSHKWTGWGSGGGGSSPRPQDCRGAATRAPQPSPTPSPELQAPQRASPVQPEASGGLPPASSPPGCPPGRPLSLPPADPLAVPSSLLQPTVRLCPLRAPWKVGAGHCRPRPAPRGPALGQRRSHLLRGHVFPHQRFPRRWAAQGRAREDQGWTHALLGNQVPRQALLSPLSLEWGLGPRAKANSPRPPRRQKSVRLCGEQQAAGRGNGIPCTVTSRGRPGRGVRGRARGAAGELSQKIGLPQVSGTE